MAVFEVTSPKGITYEVEHPGEPSQDDFAKMMAEINRLESGAGQVESVINAAPRAFQQGVGSMVEGFGDLEALAKDAVESVTGDLPDGLLLPDSYDSGKNPLQALGQNIKDAADRTFSVDPNREEEFGVKAAGAVGQAVEQAAEMLLPVSKAGALANATRVGVLGGVVKGADAGQDVAEQFKVEDDLMKRAGLMGTFGGAEVLAEKLGGFGAEAALSKILKGELGDRGLVEFGKAVAPEYPEEFGTQVMQNAATRGIVGEQQAALAGQPLPGYFQGANEAGLLGLVGGSVVASPILIPNSTKANVAAVNEAEKAGDTEAAEILRQVGQDVKMMPVPPPKVADLKPGETGLEDLLPDPAPADATPLTTEELPPEIPDLNPEPVVPPVAEAPPSIDPDPILPDEQEMEQRAFESSLIDTQGRISEPVAVKTFDAINSLIGGTTKLVVNDSGTSDPNDTGVRGSYDNGTVYLNRNLLRADTPVHELGHVFIPTLRTANPELFAQGEALIEGAAKPLADAIRARYTRNKKNLDPEAFTHEVLTTLYGNETAQDWQKYVRDPGLIQQIKQWIAKIREWADGLFRSKGIDPNMSMADYAKRLNRQVLAGKVRAPSVPVQGQQESFAGENSQFDAQKDNALVTAKLMRQQGRDPETIRQVTGWFPGKSDGKMRYEIADRGARLAVKAEDPKEILIDRASDAGFTVDFGPNKSVTIRKAGTPWAVDPASIEGMRPLITNYQYPAPPFVKMMDEMVDRSTGENPMLLPEIIDHPELFKAYPDLRGVAVLPITPDMGQGVWSKAANAIGLTTNYPWNQDTLLKTVMHEVQHAIQDIEGFTRGANPSQFTGPDAMDQYRSVPGEVESRDVERRINMSDAEMAAVPPRSMEATGQLPETEGDPASATAPSRFDEMLAREDARRAAASNGKTFRIDGVQKGFASDAPDAAYVPMFQNVTITDPTHPANGSTLAIPLEGRPAPLPDDVIQAAVDAKRNQQFSLDDGELKKAARAAGYNIGPVWHHGGFDLEQDPIPVVGDGGMHFGTEDASRARAYGKPVDDFIQDLEVTYDEDIGAWFWRSGSFDSWDLDEDGFSSELEARQAGEEFAVESGENEQSDAEEMGSFTKAFLSLKNPLRMADQGASWVKAIQDAKAKGHDGIVYTNQFEDKGSESYIVFEPEQVKSADPEVFDDNGEPIPLAERFQPRNPDVRYSLDDGTRQSGIAANQPGTPMREIAKHHIYNSETGEQAFDEALGFFMEEPNATFDQRLATLNKLINDRGRDNFNMTPGAYFGLVAEEQTAIETSPTSSPSERDQAIKNLHTLMDIMAAKAAAGGQFIKGFDLGLKLANNPRMQVDKAEELAPFDGEQGRRDEFDKEVNAVTKVMDDVALDVLSDLEETEVESIINQGAADVIRGDDASDAGAAELDAIVSKDADAAEAEDTPARKSWAAKLMDKVRSGAAKLAKRWMVVMRAINVLNRKGDSSLSEEEIDADVKKLLKSMEDAGLTKAQQLAKLRGEAATLQKQITDDKDLKTLTSERLGKNLNRLLNGKGKKIPQTSEKAIASAIVGAVMAKAGYQKPPAGTDMALAIGLLIANQGIAAESIQNAHNLLESDESTEGIISREKLKAFMELAVAKVFDKQSGADTTSAPFGEAQVASVLRAEMKKLEVTMTEAVKDAAMERQTAAQIEAQLRDPKRNLEKILGKENLDNVVNVVLGEYNKSSSKRAAELRARGEQLESEQAVREAAADSRRKRAENYKRQVERIRMDLSKATEFARQGATPEAKQSRQVRVDQLRAQLAAMNSTEAARVAQMERADALAEADRTAREAARDAKDKKRAFIRARRRARQALRKNAKKDGTPQPALDADELKDLMAQKGDTIIQYLTRNFGFNIKDLAKMVREADRRKGLEDLTLKLADQLGLTKTQAEKLLQPVIAEGMKKLDKSRAKQVENRINKAVQTATNRDAGIKKGGQKTEAERLLDLAKMGGLTADNIEKVMLNNLNAKQFTPAFRKSLEDLLTKANDPNISQESRDVYTAMFLNAVRSAQGVTAVGLLGEWTMSNIFMAVLSTLKVNAFWGFAKATVDNAVYGFYSGPKEIMDAAKEAGVNPPKGIRKAYLKQWFRGYTAQMQWNAKYMMAEGRAKDESDYTVQFSNSFFELLHHNPDTQISWTKNGAPLPQKLQSFVKALASFSKWTRRSMVGTDLVNRVSAYEMLKMTAVTKAMIEGGKDLAGQELTDHVDKALYGMPLKDALAKANKEVDAEIAIGKTRPEERTIRIGGLLDEQMGKTIGMTEDIRMIEQDRARRGAGRRTIANQTEGVYGLVSGLMLEGTRRIPGLRFLLPAVRMPIGAFVQGLDWSPWGFARYRAIKKNKGRSTSVTNSWANPDNNKPFWNLPEGGVTPDMANDLWAKAFVGTTLMVGMFIKAGMDLDEDEDKADFYITGMGPTDPVQKKLWKEKGYRPFMVRLPGGVTLNYQESPMYPIFATVGAWSDAHRYGDPKDTESAKIVYAVHKAMAGFNDAVVLRNLADIIGTGQSYSDESKAKQTGNMVARAASTVLAPRIFSEMNNILFGPLDNQHWEAKVLANIPFVPRMFDQPALDWFGHEIHTRRGDAMGEILPAVAHRISPILVDDEKLSFIYRMKPNALTTTRKKTDGSDVMDDYDLVRKWHINSGKAAEKWLTPAKMAYYDKLLKKDADAAYEEFDKELRELRQAELEKFKEVQF